MKKHSDIGHRISLAVEFSLKNQSVFSEELAVAPPNLSRWINGHVAPSYEVLVRIAAVSGVSLDWLLTGQGWMYNPGTGMQATALGIFEKIIKTKRVTRVVLVQYPGETNISGRGSDKVSGYLIGTDTGILSMSGDATNLNTTSGRNLYVSILITLDEHKIPTAKIDYLYIEQQLNDWRKIDVIDFFERPEYKDRMTYINPSVERKNPDVTVPSPKEWIERLKTTDTHVPLDRNVFGGAENTLEQTDIYKGDHVSVAVAYSIPGEGLLETGKRQFHCNFYIHDKERKKLKGALSCTWKTLEELFEAVRRGNFIGSHRTEVKFGCWEIINDPAKDEHTIRQHGATFFLTQEEIRDFYARVIGIGLDKKVNQEMSKLRTTENM